jgi:hypothetical protein
MSRAVTNKARSAFNAGRSCRVSKNTEVIAGDNFIMVLLFGNQIIWRDRSTGLVRFTFHGWNSSTTRERINGILGTGFYQSKGKLCIGNDRGVDPSCVFRLVDGVIIREDQANAE